MRKRLRAVLLVVGLGASLYAGYYYFVLGKGVPKGNWSGTFTSPAGTQGALQLVIGVAPPPGRRAPKVGGAGKRMQGTARSCIGHPASQEFDLSGRIGPDSFITLSPVGERIVGLRFGDLKVEWHGDELTVRGALTSYTGVTDMFDGANPDHMQPTTVRLHKADDAEYQTACDRLPSG